MNSTNTNPAEVSGKSPRLQSIKKTGETVNFRARRAMLHRLAVLGSYRALAIEMRVHERSLREICIGEALSHRFDIARRVA